MDDKVTITVILCSFIPVLVAKDLVFSPLQWTFVTLTLPMRVIFPDSRPPSPWSHLLFFSSGKPCRAPRTQEIEIVPQKAGRLEVSDAEAWHWTPAATVVGGNLEPVLMV